MVTGTIDAGASITNNNDGTLTVTNLPTNQSSAVPTLNIRYYDGEAIQYDITKSFSVDKLVAGRPVPRVTQTPVGIILLADYTGLTKVQSKVVTFGVLSGADNSAFVYDNTDAGTNKTFSVTVGATGGTTVTNNSDGTISITAMGISTDAATITATVKYYDEEGQTYTKAETIEVSKLRDAPPTITTSLSTPVVAFIGDGNGRVTGQSHLVTVSALENGSAMSYDNTLPYSNSSFYMTVSGGTGVTYNVSNNVITCTDMDDAVQSSSISISIFLTDQAGYSSTIVRTLSFTKTASELAIQPFLSTDDINLTADYLGNTDTQSHVVDVSVRLGSSEFTYDSAGDIGLSSYRLSTITQSPSGGATVSQNDGQMTITAMGSSFNQVNLILTIDAVDGENNAYQFTRIVTLTKVLRAAPTISLGTVPPGTTIVSDSRGRVVDICFLLL